MHIKEIIISGFRSYGLSNRMTDLSANTNIIIGANGSGKSNIFNALLFVLSDEYNRLSAQQRRQLIHDSSDERIMSAAVIIVMDNTDRRLPIDNSEVRLQRQIGLKKDQYSINGKFISYGELINLLETAGFSKSNPYYIVKQGKVNEMATASSEYRLNVMRAVAGTSVYDQKKKEALKVLDESQRRLATIEETIAYINDKLVKLEEEKQELAAFLKWDKRRRNLEFTILNKECENAKRFIASNDEKQTEINVILDAKRVKWHQIQENVKTTNNKLKSIAADIEFSRQDLTEVSHCIDEYTQRKAVIESKIKDLSEKLANDENSASNVTIKMTDLIEKIERKQQQLEQINAKFSGLKKEENEIANEIKAKECRKRKLYEKLNRKKEFKSIEERDRWIRKELPKIDSDIEAQSKRIDEMKKEMDAIDKEISDLQSEEQNFIKEEEKYKKNLISLNKTFIELNKNHKQIESKRLELWELGNSLQQNVANLNESKAKVDRKLVIISGTSATIGRESVDSVLKLFREKCLNSREEERIYKPIIDGYYGQVIDCFSCDPHMYKAIEVTAKSKLFYHIVSSDRIGTKIIEEVNRQHLFGDITFIPLNKVDVKEVNYPPLESEAAPLSSLLKFDAKYEKAMMYLFSRTLICRNLEVASTFVRSSKLDCVTLDGDFISSKGAMTGGYTGSHESKIELFLKWKDFMNKIKLNNEQSLANSKERESNANSISESSKQIEEIESELNVTKRKIENARHSKQSIKSKVIALNKKMSSYDKSLFTSEETLSYMKTSKDSFNYELEQTMSSQLNESELKEIDDINENIEILKSLDNKLFDDIIEIERQKNQLESLLFENLQPRQVELEGTLLEITVANYETDFEKQKLTLDMLNKKIDDLHKQAEEKNVKLDQLIIQESNLKTQFENMKALEEKQLEIVNIEAKKLRKLANSNGNYEKKLEEYNKKLRTIGTIPTDLEKLYSNLSLKEQYNKLRQCKQKIARFENVNQKALEQYNLSQEKCEILKREKETMDESYLSIQELINSLEHLKYEAIQFTYKQVSTFFKEIFGKLVPDGRAFIEMTCTDSQNSVNNVNGTQESQASTQTSSGNASNTTNIDNFDGVKIRVAFSGQSTSKDLDQLSGGQKSLVALAFIFAIQKCDPAPFYLFDEVDHALDPTYRTKLAQMIRHMSKESQFIATTFREELLDSADKFFGVTMKNRISHIEEIDKEIANEFIKKN